MCEGTSATPSNEPDFNVNFHLENLNLSCRNVSVSTEVWWGEYQHQPPQAMSLAPPLRLWTVSPSHGEKCPWVDNAIVFSIHYPRCDGSKHILHNNFIKFPNVRVYPRTKASILFDMQDSDFEVFIFQLYAGMPSLNPSQKLCS